jgi:hypothetical protein
MEKELWLLLTLLLPVPVLAAYRLGLRDGLWQAGRTLPVWGRKKKSPDRQKKTLADRVEEY